MADPAKDFTSLLFQTLQRWAEQVVPPDGEPVTETADVAAEDSSVGIRDAARLRAQVQDQEETIRALRTEIATLDASWQRSLSKEESTHRDWLKLRDEQQRGATAFTAMEQENRRLVQVEQQFVALREELEREHVRCSTLVATAEEAARKWGAAEADRKAMSSSRDRLIRERNEARDEVSRLRNRLQEDPYADLSAAVQRINDVVIRQIENFGSGTGLGRAADIRRRQLTRYSIEHDATEHGVDLLANAAISLVYFGRAAGWPFGRDTYDDIVTSGDQFVHAAALLMAAHDARNFKGPVRVDK